MREAAVDEVGAAAGAVPAGGRAVAGQTTAERAADVLRRQITDGELRPGSQLSEERLTAVMGISRNTLREAFRLLSHDGLLVHRLHRGVFVTELDESDLVDLYRLRRVVQCQVLRSLTDLDPAALEPVRVEVESAEAAAAQGRWEDVGTANMRFHQALAGLAGSRRIDDVTRRILAELRLVFHVVAQPQQLHEPYIRRNRALYELLAAGEAQRAADDLEDYLHESEHQLRQAYRHQRDGVGPSSTGRSSG